MLNFSPLILIAFLLRSESLYWVRFQVLTATSMRMVAFWDVAPCSVIDTDRHLRGVYCLHRQGDEQLLIFKVCIHELR
jgi:hypothetical protein